MRVNVAASSKGRHRTTPARRVGGARANIGGDAGAREEPDFDGFTGPLGGIYPAAGFVKSIAVGLGAIASDSTARVGGLAGCLDVAVARIDGAAKARIIN